MANKTPPEQLSFGQFDAEPVKPAEQEKPAIPIYKHSRAGAKKIVRNKRSDPGLDFASLNELQREAIETIDGPVLIIAGPGTGKTTVLTYRIANILKATDTKPQSVLAMTYTEAGVFAMKTKLLQLIGADAYKVNISTIHGFCNSVIQEYPEHFLSIEGFSPLSDLEKIQMTKEILEDPAFNLLCPTGKPDLYLTTLPRVLSTLKREYITPQKLAKAIEIEVTKLESINKYVTRGANKGKKVTDEYQKQENYVNKLKELLIFYNKYSEMLTQRRRYDYEDMIICVLEAMKKNEALLLSLQEKYQYFLVDEYQDTNDSQNELLFTLAEYWGQEANFFAVGDDDQSIYRFQGASVKNIRDFLKNFPNAKIITLKQNYRSQQTILDVSREFIRHNISSLEHILEGVNKELVSKSPEKPQNIKHIDLGSYVAENMYIADEIKALEKAGTAYEEMAILVRDNRDMDDLIDILQRKDIPYVRRSGNDILKNKYVVQLVNMLTIIQDVKNHPSDDNTLFAVLHYPYFDIPKVDLIKFAREVTKLYSKNLWECIFDNNDTEFLKNANISDKGIQKIKSFFDQMTNWYGMSLDITLSKLIEHVINESGMLSYLLNLEDKYQQLNVLNSFYSEVKAINTSKPDITLTEFTDTIKLMLTYGISMKERDIGLAKGGVNVITAHSSKGLEFDYVFIPKLFYKKWDNKTVRDLLSLPETLVSIDTETRSAIEEERRLFYVALTRARKNIYLTHAGTYNDDYGKVSQVPPSQFFSEMPERLIEKVDVTAYQENISSQIADLLKVTPYENVYINTVDEKEILRSIIATHRLTPTGLNTYLKCPMEYVLKVILRTPSAMEPAMIYGNAYHKALETYYATLMRTKVPLEKAKFVESFVSDLDRYPLTPSQKEKLRKKGEKHVAMYYDELQHLNVHPIKTEHQIKTMRLGGASITGRIDRVDSVDYVKKYVVLCDYKTGGTIGQADLDKTPTRVLGDRDKGQRYYNQLMFYKVLSEIDPYLTSFNATAVQGKLIFIDPERETFVERIVEYSHDQVEDMKQLIISVWEDIQKLEFPRKHTKDSDDCVYCKIGLTT